MRFNAVSPGTVYTLFHERHTRPEVLESIKNSIPMKRLGTPEDCAGAYLFLACDDLSGYITGQTVEVNGGQFMAGRDVFRELNESGGSDPFNSRASAAAHRQSGHAGCQ